MKFLAHRGLWNIPIEKNTLDSLKSALSKGFGIETDFRDYNGELVISHDVATVNSPKAESFFKFYHEIKSDAMLAINVKADGIQNLILPLLESYNIHNYFLFDMSIPEYVVNVDKGLNSFTRHSDIECECVMYERAKGVWMDSFFDTNWLSLENIKKHLKNNKKVCIVSPELHGKDKYGIWGRLKANLDILNDDTLLCTDTPEEAEVYFYGKED